MKHFLFLTVGIIVIASLIFLLGYLVGRGYNLGEEPIARSLSARKVEEKKVAFPPSVAPVIVPPREELPFAVQVASSQSEEKALALVNRLRTKGYPAYVEGVEIEGTKWFRVRVGTFPSKEDALNLVEKLREEEGLRESMVWKR